ncbi:DUF3135 domain-containing protein [Dechloromonas sp. XY25]|uniref:DUF3135 domain-containing protein n=1 Tax=Dechloromonas hankyongensis TaxID=2908002 RepID=A0ABS9K7W0_9RHOO|nr:DUF3135 domain-containing protein [Dechloromonas hankyongensis]MCG2579189.1 DUF3135 domain-containing protein [Dechloromonas hankyongensis]
MPENFERLVQLAPGDGPGFVRLRHALITELIAHPSVNAGSLTALQREIDCRRATALAPEQAMVVVMQLLEERITELKVLTEKLAQLNVAPT